MYDHVLPSSLRMFLMLLGGLFDPTGVEYGALWLLRGLLGGLLAQLGALLAQLGPLGALLGSCWRHLGLLWLSLELLKIIEALPSSTRFPFIARTGLCWGLFGSIGVEFGALWALWGPMLGSWGLFLALQVPTWTHTSSFWSLGVP